MNYLKILSLVVSIVVCSNLKSQLISFDQLIQLNGKAFAGYGDVNDFLISEGWQYNSLEEDEFEFNKYKWTYRDSANKQLGMYRYVVDSSNTIYYTSYTISFHLW